MKSEVGFIGSGTKAAAVRGLEEQERGGTIGARDFIPMNPSRVGTSENKQVKAANRIKSIRNIDRLRNKNLQLEMLLERVKVLT